MSATVSMGSLTVCLVLIQDLRHILRTVASRLRKSTTNESEEFVNGIILFYGYIGKMFLCEVCFSGWKYISDTRFSLLWRKWYEAGDGSVDTRFIKSIIKMN